MNLTTEEIMEITPYIEINRKKGKTPQYYLVRKKLIDGKVKRVWSMYLGTPRTIEKFYRENKGKFNTKKLKRKEVVEK